MTKDDRSILDFCGPEYAYEIHFRDEAGTAETILKVVALDDDDAKLIATRMRAEQKVTAYVMHTGKLVAALYPPIEY